MSNFVDIKVSLEGIQGRRSDIIMVIGRIQIVPIETVGHNLAPHVFICNNG